MDLLATGNLALAYIAQWSNGGVIVPSGDNADYTLRRNKFIDAAQKEVATRAKIHAVYSFSQNPITPLNGRYLGFALKQFLPGISGDLIDISGTNGRAFYTEIDRPCSIYAEESSNGTTWTLVPSVSYITGIVTGTANPIVVSGITQFTVYKGLITPTLSTNQVRLRFTGSYPFNRRNTALYNVPFATTSDVAIYNDRIEYVIPDINFMEFNKCVHRSDDRVYEQMIDLSAINRKTFVVNYFYTGSFDIWYYKVPETITDTTPDNTELEVYPGSPQIAIAKYVASRFVADEYPSLAANLYAEYANIFNSLDTNEPQGTTEVYSTSGW